MKKKLLLSIVAPVFNEEEIIEEFLNELLSVLKSCAYRFEIILIDDGSMDQTIQRCLPYIEKYPEIRLLSFSRNYGHEIASTAGLDCSQGDYVVLMDSDLQHPPIVIPQLIEKAQQGYDVVCAARTNRDQETWFKKCTAKLFYKFSRKLTGLTISEEIGNFRILSRKVVDSITKMKESNRHLIMMFAYVGYKTATIDYTCPPRKAGQSKYSLRKLVSLALDSIIGFSSRPLRLMSLLSIFLSLIMMGYAGFILIQKLFTHQQLADGMASIIFLISGLFSVLFLFLAVISEYISRILIETKNRPLYTIKEEISQLNFQTFEGKK